jgi:hypothetical protein
MDRLATGDYPAVDRYLGDGLARGTAKVSGTAGW